MSFKRDDTTSGAVLKNLQHRRVSDLIGNIIPEEEAALLSNGRLTCLVCNHRPIFDTISVLSVHRKGKKHISVALKQCLLGPLDIETTELSTELSEYLTHKRDLEIRAMHRSGGISLLSASPANQSLSSASSPYSSCVKRARRSQGGGRRMCLDIAVATDLAAPSEPVFPSAASQVRQYLKNLSRKKSLEKAVEKRRENTVSNIQVAVTSTGQSQSSQPKPDQPVQYQHNAQPLRSGWLLDARGDWVRDPEAEFDSDEAD